MPDDNQYSKKRIAESQRDYLNAVKKLDKTKGEIPELEEDVAEIKAHLESIGGSIPAPEVKAPPVAKKAAVKVAAKPEEKKAE